MPAPDLSRYARQIALPEVGLAGQARLADARVLIVGAGGLGSPAALWLAAAGVGRIGLADHDRVDRSNLHRQLLYAPGDEGTPKVEAARARLAAVAPDARIDLHHVEVTAANAPALVQGYDVVLDCTDQIPVRYALSDACVAAGRPLVHGAVSRWEGRVTVLAASEGPCYRCLWPTPPPAHAIPSCAEAGVLGPVPGAIGMLQAVEASKLLLGAGDPLVGRLLVMDLLRMVTHVFAVPRDPLCPTCAAGQIRQAGMDGAVAVSPDAPYPSPEPSSVSQPSAGHPAVEEISPVELAARLGAADPPLVLDVREPWEHDIAHLAGARLVPLNQLPAALSTLDPARALVTMCHHGVRSRMAAEFLRERGLTRVANLSGGIDAWSEDVDASVPRY
ncbi:ThiF family adenylyltransferase [Roseisolibacter agri]|uniref:Molybdopterin-synthase adenylyltransferase n=1 Tax=Roseisolibacter agri TaxID=2014610 RepID=A0AA37QFI5_9BACT|nr:ThiF family adenylyltransferase [Roseisolibacter agri]GLC25863.1 molybdenum cofactor biosynthesis protein MoeB [Roseisolibacter agri]